MTQEDYRDDMLYHAALSMGKALLEKGLITQKEYGRIKEELLRKYDPYLGKLLSESACYLSYNINRVSLTTAAQDSNQN